MVFYFYLIDLYVICVFQGTVVRSKVFAAKCEVLQNYLNPRAF